MPHEEPWAARLHFVARAIRTPQEALVSLFRRDVERSPHWVLLTTRGRKTGLPREVLLPCAREGDRVLVISTYGWRSAWIRNVEACRDVEVTVRGEKVAHSRMERRGLPEPRERFRAPSHLYFMRRRAS